MICDACALAASRTPSYGHDAKEHHVPDDETPREPEGALTTYSELAAIIQHLPVLVEGRRRQERLTYRGAAEQAGVSLSTLWRVETGRGFTGGSLAAILCWLDTPTGGGHG